MLPTLFVSHGAPTIVASRSPAADFLRGLPALLPEAPRAVLCVSAHWETDRPSLNSVTVNETIHDFGGFPRELYQIRYPAPGAPQTAAQAAELLAQAGFEPQIDHGRGLDHGAWTPLILAWPQAEVPVLQLSVQPSFGPRRHLDLGRALAPLRREGVLILGSGGLTHNLRDFRGQAEDSPELDYAHRFAEWVGQAIGERRIDDLVDYRRLAPEAARNHPSEEHFLPLLTVLGAGLDDDPVHLHQSTTFGFLRMDAFGFGRFAGL